MYSHVHTDHIRKTIAHLKSLVEHLEERGSTVIFYEMPTHPRLCQSDKMEAIRKEAKAVFPDHVYLKTEDCSLFQTTDSHHLTDESAYTYVSMLLKYLFRTIDKEQIYSPRS